MATNPQTLFNEANCYLCFEITEDEALELALLARIAGGSPAPPVDENLRITEAGDIRITAAGDQRIWV